MGETVFSALRHAAMPSHAVTTTVTHTTIDIVYNVLTLVIPVRNEALTIGDVLRAARATPDLVRVQIVVVDDGSTDDTRSEVKRFACGDRLVQYTPISRSNKDVALWAAVSACSTPWIVCMDGDGQYDAQDIPELRLMDRSQHCGAVWGVRNQRCDTCWRRVQSVAGLLVKRCVLGPLAARDPGCGLFAVRRTLFAAIVKAIPQPCGHVHCHIPEIVHAWGYDVAEHAITHRSRAAGMANYGALNRIVSGYKSLRQARHTRSAFNNDNCHVPHCDAPVISV